MGLFDASSRSSSTDNRQTAGDAAQQLHGQGNKVIQGGSDLSKANINTGTSIKGSKINTTNKVTVNGANPSDLTLLASQAINQLGQSNTNSSSLLSTLANAVTSSGSSSGSGSGSNSGDSLSSLATGALAGAGIGSATPGTGSAGSNPSWWSTLPSYSKILLAVGVGLLLIAGLLHLGKKL